MKLAGEYAVAAPRQHVWSVLLDPSLLARILPGCEKLEALGDDTYQARVKIQVGPLQGTFDGTIKLGNINAPESYTMTFDGKGALGFVKGTGEVHLIAQENSTQVTYTGEASIGGRIASVGQRLMESSAKAMIKQTLDEIAPIAQTLAAAEPPAAAVPADPVHPVAPPQIVSTVKPHSQLEFGLGILRHLFEDTVPQPYRLPVLLVGGIILLFIVIRLLEFIARVLFR
jgi:uncharacterized protein